MMALPLKWQDRFADLGYLEVLHPASLRLLMRIGRRINGVTLETSIKLARLHSESKLLRSVFYKAKAELAHHGLVTRAKRDGRWWITLASSPSTPKSPFRWTKKSRQADLLVRPGGPTNGETPTQSRQTAHSQQQIKTQLGKQISSLLPALGLDEDILPMLLGQKQVEELCRGDVTLDDIAYNLSRALQSCGHPVYEKKVRAALDQDVQMASRVFGARIVDI